MYNSTNINTFFVNSNILNIKLLCFSFIRRFAAQQFLLIVKFSWSVDPLLLSSTISFMFSVLNETVLKFVKKSKVYFYVSYCNLI